MSNAFNSDITQNQMFIIEKQKASKSVGHHFPLYDNDSRDIKICWLFLMPGFNTGLCQCSSPKTLFRDLEQKEREKERERERERERGPQVSQLQAQLNPKVNGLEESQS